MNMKRCVLPVVKVGAVSDGKLTDAGQVTVPLVCVSSNVNAYAQPVGTLANVNVLLPLMVFVK